MAAAPSPLPENTGLAFTGEAEWPAAIITTRQAETLAALRNPAGRPNNDVLKSYIGKAGNRLREHWQIDFPAHYNEQEAALHERPFALLGKNIGRKSNRWWINPHAQLPLRHALARVDRFLATALDAAEPAWAWFESEQQPNDTLLVIARDDDFTHAVLQSTAFTTWWRAHHPSLTPVQIVESFPFPWPPSTPLGSLTKTQQELRSEIVRAGLANDAERIDSILNAAYGWPSCRNDGEVLPALLHLHGLRGGAH